MAPKFYASRKFDMDPEALATITLEVGGDWVMSGPGGPFRGKKGEYTLVFTPSSPTSLISITIDPDPGGGIVPGHP